MDATMDVRMKRAQAGREGARRRWGADREPTRMVHVFARDAETLGLLASTSADAVRWLMNKANVHVYQSDFPLTIADSKVLSHLRENNRKYNSPPWYVEGVQITYLNSKRLMTLSFPAEKLDELLASARLELGDTCAFKQELRKAAKKAANGGVVVTVFSLVEP